MFVLSLLIVCGVVSLSCLKDVTFLNFGSSNEETLFRTTFHNLAQIVKIDVTIPMSLQSVSCFQFCRSVTLYRGENITDVSPLRTASRVKLSGFPLVVNINSLGHVPSLTLCQCSSIADISGLGKSGQNHVELFECHKIADFSPLSEVKIVTIHNCKLFCDDQEISGVSNLSLHCYHGPLSGFHFHHLKRLEISCHNCTEPFPLNLFRNIENITLFRCDFVSIEGIGYNKTVVVERCHQLTDISAFKNVPDVTIIYCYGINDITPLRNATRIRVKKNFDQEMQGYGTLKVPIAIWQYR
jgi:hypothetical protein